MASFLLWISFAMRIPFLQSGTLFVLARVMSICNLCSWFWLELCFLVVVQCTRSNWLCGCRRSCTSVEREQLKVVIYLSSVPFIRGLGVFFYLYLGLDLSWAHVIQCSHWLQPGEVTGDLTEWSDGWRQLCRLHLGSTFLFVSAMQHLF
jgi:hypothetical protein